MKKSTRYSVWWPLFFLFLFNPLLVSASDQPPNILLITLDTTRADHLGCYGYKNAATPALDKLASEGAKFELAFSSVPITLPSHATILTGLYPFRTGARDNGLDRVPPSAQTLAELLRSHGYHTLAFVSSAVLDRAFGLDQGFDLYDDNVRIGNCKSSGCTERTASQVNNAVFERLTTLVGPYFLWVHYYDAHSSYNPPPPFDHQYAGHPYDGEISFADSQIQVLLDRLRSRNLLDRTMIVVAADHGESLGEHDEQTHGVFIYDSVLHVPFIVVYPGIIKERTSVNGLVRLVDVFPTILDYAGITIPPGLDGSSLKESVARGKSNETLHYEESQLPENTYGWSPLYGVRTPEWHFILAPQKELYNVVSDPREEKNLAGQSPEMTSALEARLRSYSYEGTRSVPSGVPEELKERLASLGYVSSSRSPGSNPRIDPKEEISFQDDIARARDLVSKEKYKEANEIYLQVLKKNPQNMPAREALGRSFMEEEEYEKAQLQYEIALKYDKVDFLYFNLANVLAAQGKIEGAVANFQNTLSVNPRYAQAYVDWADLELSLEHRDKAIEILDKAISLDVRDAKLFLMRGRLAASRRDFPAAIKFYQQAVQQDDQYEEAYAELGHAHYKLHQVDQSVALLEKALSLKPDNIWTLKALAHIYWQDKKDPRRAREYYQKALASAPDGPEAAGLRTLIQELSK